MAMPRLRRSVLLLLPMLVLLAACGGDGAAPEAATSDPAAEVESTSQTAPEARLNVNTATEDEMLAIPGVGERMVHEFEEYRPYVSIQQFRREIGKYVDEEQVAAYEEYIYVPVSPNDSDAATLAQLPGVDQNEAETLIEARPFASREAFLEALSGYVSEDELTTAQQYLADDA